MTKTDPSSPPQSPPDRREAPSAAVGLLVVLSMVLLSIVFTAPTSFQFALGYTAGKFFISLALALPIYTALRYATQRGKNLTSARAINLLCFLIVGIWAIQLLLVVAVPIGIRNIESSHNSPAKLPAVQQEHKPWEMNWAKPDTTSTTTTPAGSEPNPFLKYVPASQGGTASEPSR